MSRGAVRPTRSPVQCVLECNTERSYEGITEVRI